jgi:predicted RNA-binding Zn-ribbon protein involved in translation (DUF1610 family)
VTTRFQPATAASNPIIRPECPQCGTTMLLARIEPLDQEKEMHTFECPMCEHSISVKSELGTPPQLEAYHCQRIGLP